MPLAKAAKRAGSFQLRADHGRALAGRQPSAFQVGADDVARFGGVAGEREPDAVEDGALAEVHDVGGDGWKPWC